MERPRCKLCSRTFANGRALGGHMKAHLSTLTTTDSTSISSSSAASSRDSTQEENGDDKTSIYGLRENPRRSLKFSDPKLSSQNEAEEDSEADTIRRRPKRGPAEEEDAAIAMCLVMLSRDKWTAPAAKSDVKRHRCEVCHKAFRSSQALGGHRVTHRKVSNVKEEAKKYRRRFLDDETENIFECPYCFKVFGSGQALGGHKRSHLVGSGNGSPLSSGKARNHKRSSSIDLNLPAPPEEDDDRSVVSDSGITEPAGRT